MMKAIEWKYYRRQLIFSWLGGKQWCAHPYAALSTEILDAHCVENISPPAYVLVRLHPGDEWHSLLGSDQPRPAGFTGGTRRRTQGGSSTQIPPKAALEQRLNPFMWGLFLCPEWQMHVWTPTVSKCWFKGCKPAASKHESCQKAEREEQQHLATRLNTVQGSEVCFHCCEVQGCIQKCTLADLIMGGWKLPSRTDMSSSQHFLRGKLYAFDSHKKTLRKPQTNTAEHQRKH